MPNSISQVQPALEFIPPAFNPLILQGCKFLLPWWLRFRTPIGDIQAANVETLANFYREFQSGKVRFLVAFRHPSTEDPFCLAHLIWNLLPQVAREQGMPLKTPLHSHFIYDRGIPLWAGSSVGWLYSQLGGTPIIRGKIDRLGLRSARNLFANGNFPIAAAPEGATNGHNEIVSPLEPGIAQLGFWCAEDLYAAGRTETVFIIPLGIQYRYVTPPWEPLEQLLTELEADSGLSPLKDQTDSGSGMENSGGSSSSENLLRASEHLLYRRLMRLGGHLLAMMEEFYTRFYPQTLAGKAPTLSSQLPTETAEGEANEALAARLHALLDIALQVAEQYFNLKSKGSLIDRCRRLEQAGWDYIYREDIKDIGALSPLDRGLADRIAEEASLRMWHMRLVESFVAVTGKYVQEKPTVERFAETTLLLWDVMARIKGGSPFSRPQLGKQRVKVTVGQPISVSERWGAYQTSRRQAVAQLTQDLQTALEATIGSE